MEEKILAIRERIRKTLPTLEELASKPIIDNRDKRKFLKVTRGPLREAAEDLRELGLIESKAYKEIRAISTKNPKYFRGNTVRGILRAMIPYA